MAPPTIPINPPPAFYRQRTGEITSQIHWRAAQDHDAPGLIALISSCYGEYPGCIVDLEDSEQDLRAIASAFTVKGGKIWVAQDASGLILACGGYKPISAPLNPLGARSALELCRLYVAAKARGQGLARTLIAHIEALAKQSLLQPQDSAAVELWSDTRFTRAHSLYELLGYRPSGNLRALHDQSHTIEYHYYKAL
jgi:putative acetyltransferase